MSIRLVFGLAIVLLAMPCSTPAVAAATKWAGPSTDQPRDKSAASKGKAKVDRGRALFSGEEPLSGHIRDHGTDLPSEVIRCINCHGADAVGPKTSGAAPRLTALWLLEARVRRGGPPVAYDRDDFCALLRTGVDPVHILVGREMPIYRIDDASCTALWKFLSENQPASKTPSKTSSKMPSKMPSKTSQATTRTAALSAGATP